MDFSDLLTAGGLSALVQVLAIDLMLAGDNVVVLGTLVARLSSDQRRKVLAIGVGIALAFRIGFALVATQLLQIIGLLFAGGLLLLWVAWKLFRELRADARGEERDNETRPASSFGQAVIQVALADLSMSLDNVLGVAGAAREHPTVLLLGLAGSVALMAVAANLIAGLIERHRWMAYLGLGMILWVAARMIWEGAADPAIGLFTLLR